MRTIVYPYKIGSASAKAISRVLNAVRVRPVGRYTPRGEDFIINWGASTVPAWYEALRGVQRLVFLNTPESVANAANKLRTFNILQAAGVSIPEFTHLAHEARAWVENHKVYIRGVLTGHSGAGITVIQPHNIAYHTSLGAAPLFVKGIENHGEYRVHVVNGEVIDYIKKRRRNDDQPNQQQNDIRNLANGWVYTRQNLRRLERIEQLAIDAVRALGLDFGAVDIIKDQNGDVFVLEVNTACGMSETTLAAYTNAFTSLIQAHATR